MVACARLLVILSDPLTPLIKKGEVTARYYNPGGVFSEVHIFLLNDDKPNLSALQYMVGKAQVFIHNFVLPSRLNVKSFGWQSPLLEWLLRGVLPCIKAIEPDVVRTHGLNVELFVAQMAKKHFGIPHVASVHTNPQQPARAESIGRRFLGRGLERLRGKALSSADAVLPVYEPAVPFLQNIGIRDYQVCYNVLNPSAIKRKENYKINQPIRVACVSRQFESKNPSNIIRAVTEMENVHITLFGDGELHGALKQLVEELNATDCVEFVPAIDNSQLCSQLAHFDIFAVQSDHWEISKAVLEALLTGLPLIMNRLENYKIPELSDGIGVLVDNSTEGYKEALRRLIFDDLQRETLGRHAQEIAWQRWDPSRTEVVYSDLYHKILGEEP